jgi:fatty acid amide hydrolase 2
VDAHISRIQQVNAAINAIVADRFALARAEADAIDRRRMLGEPLPQLAGVPFTVKEMIDCEGMPNTFGCDARRTRRALSDATIVQRLKSAGAIPIASTNIPEWGLWYETANLIYGRTRNPHNTAHTTGGSSGGEGAAVAARASAFGLGSDIGGSIRIPAALCGVFGHKPSSGLLPLTGHYPVYRDGPDAALSKNNPWVVVGPLTRSASDLMPLVRIMAGQDGVDPNTSAIGLGDGVTEWDGRTAYVLADPRIKLAGRAQPDVRAATERVARAFAERGANIKQFDPGFFHDDVMAWFAALQSLGTPSLHDLLSPDGDFSLVRELLRHITRSPRFSFPALGFCAVEGITRFPPAKLQTMLDGIARKRETFDRMMRDAILIMPPHPRTAPRHRVAMLHPFGYAFTAVFNNLQAPVTAAPTGLARNGLPLGVQIASAHGNDALTMSAALVVEDVFGRAPLPAL